ncbi:MAG: hypothetical protein HN337_03070 [Deltaproteobacteria bacterium]|nr:hypothetical protein [Deltaproteobacteria bacterium]
MNEQAVMDIQTQMQQGMGAGIGIGMILFMIVVYLFFSYCLARLAVKTGMTMGNAFIWAVIPIANIFLMMKIAGKPMWWIILMLIPIVNFVIAILVWMAIAERMGRPGWWGILIALVPVVNLILFMILAFEAERQPQVAAI